MLFKLSNQSGQPEIDEKSKEEPNILEKMQINKSCAVVFPCGMMRSFPVWSMWVRISFMTMLLIFSNEWSTGCQVNHIYRLYKERAISIAVTTLLPTVWISSMGLVLLMVMSVCTFPMNYKGLEMENLLGYRSLHSTYGGDMFWVW